VSDADEGFKPVPFRPPALAVIVVLWGTRRWVSSLLRAVLQVHMGG